MRQRAAARVSAAFCATAAVCATVAACGPDGGADAPGAPATWTVAPEPELKIGGGTAVRSEDDSTLFQTIQSAHLLPDGRIVVADRGLNVVRVYGPDGALRVEFGGPGEGPGEFGRISGSWITPDGEVAVWDAGSQRIATFRLDGELVSSHRPEMSGDSRHPMGPPQPFLDAFGDGDALLASLGPRKAARGEVVADRTELARFGLDGELEARLGEVPGMRRAGGRRPVPFSPMPHTVALGDSVFTAEGYGPAIIVRGPGGDSARTLELPGLARREIDPDRVWSELEAELRRRGRLDPEASVEDMAGGPLPLRDRFPHVADLLADDRGRIWVKGYELPDDALWLSGQPGGSALWPDPGGEWWVVRPDGEAVATVQMPEDVRPLDVSNGRIVGVVHDEMDVESLVVHAIRR